MKLGEFLEERARLIKEICSLEELRSMEFRELKDSPSEVRFKDITEQINQKRKELRELKLRLMKLNLSTKIPGHPEISSMMELNLKIADIIEEIRCLRSLDPHCSYGSEIQPQLSPKELRRILNDLVREKVRLDVLRKMTNWSTEVE